jgi:hypothetical protein
VKEVQAMVCYGYTLDHIAPKRLTARAGSISPYPRVICAAVILGTSAALWTAVFEAVKYVVL